MQRKHFQPQSCIGPKLEPTDNKPMTQMACYLKDLADLLDVFTPHMRRTAELMQNNESIKSSEDKQAIVKMAK